MNIEISKPFNSHVPVQISQKHPVQIIQELRLQTEEQMKLKDCAMLFGSNLPMQLAMERTALGQPNRLKPLKSSMLGLNVSMNRMMKMEFEDCLNYDKFEQ